MTGHEKWIEIRKVLTGRKDQCHDCRALREQVIAIMDNILPPPAEVSADAFAKASEPPTIRAHSEVTIKEPIERIDDGDSVRVTISKERKVL